MADIETTFATSGHWMTHKISEVHRSGTFISILGNLRSPFVAFVCDNRCLVISKQYTRIPPSVPVNILRRWSPSVVWPIVKCGTRETRISSLSRRSNF